MQKNTLNAAQSTYLDFARAIAAFAVLYGHSSKYFLAGGLTGRTEIESAGVMVFFLLSGFLISYTVFQKLSSPDYGFRNFFIDRFSRIYIAYIPALIFVWLIDSYTRTLPVNILPDRVAVLTQFQNMYKHFDLTTWIGNVFMLQNYPVFQVLRRALHTDSSLFTTPFGSDTPLWTVAIEWWLYMLFGYVVLCLGRARRFPRLPQLALLGFLSVVPFYYLIGGPVDCLTLLWLIGLVASLSFINFRKWFGSFTEGITPSRVWLYSALIVSFAVVAMIGRLFSRQFDYGIMSFRELQFGLFMAVALFAPLIALGTVKKVPALLEKTATFFSGYSYSLYLIHTPIIVCLYVSFPYHDSDVTFFWIATSVAHVVAIAFWWLFERHYRTLAKWLKTRSLKAA